MSARVPNVLLVDRDPAAGREILAHLADRGYEIEWVDDAEKAFNRLDDHPFDVLIAELNIRRTDGLRLMAVATERNPDVCVILITDHPGIERATDAMREGAYDFQTKPVNLGKLDAVIQRGLDHQRLVLEQHELHRRLDEHYGFGNLVGNSRPMIRLYNAVRKAAPGRMPVLIRGESGTGKDLVAFSVHNNSPRRDEPFVQVQCDVPEARTDSDLFGDASGTPRGRVELADGGTLFLDEVGELTPAQQAGILQVVRNHRVQRLGGTRPIRVDVRVIASTTRPLESPAFREDLLEILGEVIIDVPALRDRRDDIPLLVHHFLREAVRSSGAPVAGISRHALELLARYDWPGNVRELKNVIEGMALVADGSRPLDVHDVPQHVRRAATLLATEIRIPIGTAMRDVERVVIEETMRACGFKKDACAKTLGIGLRTLYRKLEEYNIH